jgi:glycosyltransferase involved in cell wall biosynthesis
VKLFPESSYYDQQAYDLVNKLNKEGRVRFISQGYFLNPKACDLYGLPPDTPIRYLPNPVEFPSNPNAEDLPKKNNIIFLGRIESVKRGWLFCEIAKQIPEYDFYVLGQTFREKEKNSRIMTEYSGIGNLHFAGHVDGLEKKKFLTEAKILVNTSIHEALPVSFLEALAHGTLLVSNRNPENLTSQFGIWVGNVLGDGFDKVDAYVSAIRKIMQDDAFRKERAVAATAYIREVHSIEKFVRDMRQVVLETVGLSEKPDQTVSE